MKGATLLIIAFTILTACKKDRITGEGTVVSQSRSVSGFTQVHTAGSTNVYITQGDQFSVEVRGYENLLPYLETKVVDNELRIGFRKTSSVQNDNTEVRITMPVLNGLRADGSGHMITRGDFSGNAAFTVDISGSSNIEIEKGSAEHFTGHISGSGNIKAFGLSTVQTDITVDGSGNTEISVSQKLNATLSGSGNVYYKGNPTVNARITGSSQVIAQ
ncbi:DUF2807 domain-containing protein [Flavihumibacter sp. R14]|nr:DUF2807 domain-containing protein [Flavihumibacter soli]